MKTFTLKKLPAFILMMFSFAFVSTQTTPTGPGIPSQVFNKAQSINPVIGDISFVTKYGCLPDVTTDEDLRITTHFEYVENLLRQKDVSSLSPELQKNREHLISLFHDYKIAGKFPKNYDYPGVRKPCFIDKDNTICAVGYLVEQTAGRKAAEEINAKFKYDDVLDMHDALVDNWVAHSGLSKEEVAMIQPTYGGGWPPPCNGNKIYVCRWSNCVYECKCISPNNADQWQSNGSPCDTLSGNNGNGNGNGNGGVGNGNGNGNGFSGAPGSNNDFIENGFEIYPNPVSSVATIDFSLDQKENTLIQIFDLNGRLISTLAEGLMDSGSYEVEWNAEEASPGIYLLRLAIGDAVRIEKISVMN